MQRTFTLGLVADGVATSPYAGQMINGAQSFAWEHGYMLLVVETGGDKDVEAAAFQKITERQVDGLIYATLFTHEIADPSERADGVPLVLANCFTESDKVPSVVPDEYLGSILKLCEDRRGRQKQLTYAGNRAMLIYVRMHCVVQMVLK